MHTKSDFDAAARTLLGEVEYQHLTAGPSPQNRAELCSWLARQAFIGRLASTDQQAMDVVRSTARSLWAGDGSLGLA